MENTDTRGGCRRGVTFSVLDCISPIAKDDSKWRDTLVFAAIL